MLRRCIPATFSFWFWDLSRSSPVSSIKSSFELLFLRRGVGSSSRENISSCIHDLLVSSEGYNMHSDHSKLATVVIKTILHASHAWHEQAEDKSKAMLHNQVAME